MGEFKTPLALKHSQLAKQLGDISTYILSHEIVIYIIQRMKMHLVELPSKPYYLHVWLYVR